MIVIPLLCALQEVPEGYRAESFTFDGAPYEYRLRVPPEPAPPGGHPLLLLLHGAGERGSDNELQLTHVPGNLPGYVLIPQCRADRRWVEVDWDSERSTPMAAEASPMLRMAYAALDDVLDRHPIDGARIYVMGLSMGGFGAWELGMRHPERFAAVVPICGGGDETQAARLADTPVWAWHGVDDPVIPVGRSRAMVEALRATAAPVRYTELPEGVGHFAWKPAFESAELSEWLYSQSRGPKAPPPSRRSWLLVLAAGMGAALLFFRRRSGHV